ncbi:hypothetical protein CDL15_Pgr014790 [Punica granatum]|uniref:Aldehyde dehydrogenase domain-containing protein n=2 Tax=Punica granatum TaxID=22663 RepID=A0A218XZK7_PUNGR|nr:hypothetical protein CDL15_Pgr014790 [Punica granatum]
MKISTGQCPPFAGRSMRDPGLILERSLVLLRFADLVEKHSEELTALETWNNGKPYEQSLHSELPSLAVPADGNYHLQTLHEPIGIVGQIIPQNFPLSLFAWKVGPALARGNTVILKSAEQTTLTALYAAKLLHEPMSVFFLLCLRVFLYESVDLKLAGLPLGVLNVVSGYGPTAGAALASHMEADKLSFTGSTEAGKIILELAAKGNLKPVMLELGGKSSFIICEDADVDKAVDTAPFALFFNQGQYCCAGSRTFLHERIYDEFVEKAKARAMSRVVGDPFKKGVEQGPQNNMPIAQDEIFGPVQTILKFKDLDEVTRRANPTLYVLAAGVFTGSVDTTNTLTRVLRVGTVWVNCYDVFDDAIPFGGYKMSGIGWEKGIYSLNAYLQVKAIITPLSNPAWL